MIRRGMFTIYKDKEFYVSRNSGRNSEKYMLFTKDIEDEKLGFRIYEKPAPNGIVGDKQISAKEMGRTVRVATYGYFHGEEVKVLSVKDREIFFATPECKTQKEHMKYESWNLELFEGVYYRGKVSEDDITNVFEEEMIYDVFGPNTQETEREKRYLTSGIERYKNVIDKKASFLYRRGFLLDDISEYIIYYSKNDYKILIYSGRYLDRPSVEIEFTGTKERKREMLSIGWIRAVMKFRGEVEEKNLDTKYDSRLETLLKDMDFLKEHFKLIVDYDFIMMCKDIINNKMIKHLKKKASTIKS